MDGSQSREIPKHKIKVKDEKIDKEKKAILLSKASPNSKN